MKKTVMILALSAALCFPLVTEAQYFEADGIVYGITSEAEHTVEVWPYYALLDNPYSGAVTIPSSVEHDGMAYTVTALGDEAFSDCTGITALTLPPCIRHIGPYCFYNTSFTTMQLPDSLRTIADHAFLYSSVTALHLPACFEEYGECAFWARNLASVTVDEANPRYRSIDGWLYSRDSLTLMIVPTGTTGAVSVPSYVRSLSDMAFGFCSRITSVSLPEGLTSIGDFAFNCCSAVDGIVIPATVTHIGLCPFSYCPQLNNLSLAEGNTHYVLDGLMLYSAGYDTLVSCHKSGTTVTLNPNIRVLGGFENNTWVRNLDIPENVTDILDNCFNGCSFSTIALPAHMRSIGAKAFSENNNLARITMPQTLLTMGPGAFEWCMGLTSVVIPDSLRVIPKEAFNSCPRLASITWGNAVEEIGYAAFWAQASTVLTLPPTLRKVGDYAFAACSNRLRKVSVQGQLDTMGEYVFESANLEELRFYGSVPPAVTGAGPLGRIGSLDVIVVCGLDNWLADSYWGQFADKYVEECGGIADVEACEIEVYPNPATDRLTIRLSDRQQGGQIELVDLYGRTVRARSIVNADNQMDVSALGRGAYILRLHTPTGTVNRKVVLR